MSRAAKSPITGALITCEHASNVFPNYYRQFITDIRTFDSLLKTHRGYDAGALELAIEIGKLSKLKVLAGKASRLLVDLNRSSSHKNLHFKDLRKLGKSELSQIIRVYYTPYRKAVQRKISQTIREHGTTVHVSVHSFTPVFNGKKRRCDIGILFNPDRKSELRSAKRLRSLINASNPQLKVWFNHPYRGTSDGLTTSLRKIFSDKTYAGVEIELNQNLMTHKNWNKTKITLATAIAAFLGEAKI